MHIATDSVVAATSGAADMRWSRRNKKTSMTTVRM